MRSFTIYALAAATLAGALPAKSADLDYGVLRGSDEEYAAPVDWTGFYIAGHGGYTTSNFGYGKAGQADLALILQGLLVENEYHLSTANKLRDARSHDGSFGAIGGYNFQVDDVVYGIEFDYTSANQKGIAEGVLSRKAALSNGLFDSYTISTRARTVLQDYGTVRGRIGYAFGSFMPYVTAGGVFGRALVGNSVHVSLREYTDVEQTNLVGQLDKGAGSIKEKYRFGAALGVGAEYLITQNIFARAEYQYLLFDKFGDTSVNVSTVRGAVGVKF